MLFIVAIDMEFEAFLCFGSCKCVGKIRAGVGLLSSDVPGVESKQKLHSCTHTETHNTREPLDENKVSSAKSASFLAHPKNIWQFDCTLVVISFFFSRLPAVELNFMLMGLHVGL